MKRSRTGIIVALALTLFSINGTAMAETMTCTDKLGRTVTVAVPVNRAVFFQIYELIPALGIWDKVVGIGRWAHDNDLMKAAKPEIANVLPAAGTGVDVNIETLLTLKPDVVITWTFKPEAVKFMEEKGLNVIAVFPESLAELYDVMRLQGKLFGKENRAEAVIKEMEKVFALVKEKVPEIPSQSKKKVLWLYGSPTRVACASVPSDLIRMTGGINPAAGISQADSDVSMEQIIAWNPDVIFIWGYAGYSAQTILESAQWRPIKAVTEGRVYKAPPWSNWSPAVASVALWMAMKTYPDSFKDADFKRVCNDFYREVYGVPYEKVSRIEK